jgi:hypothetical protein
VTVWFAGPRREPGLYALPLGDLAEEGALVDPLGIRPNLQYDEQGTLHVSWAHHPPGYEDTRFFYAAYPDGLYQPGRETEVVSPILGLTSVLHGPRLGLDWQRAYLFWTVEVRTGQQAGQVETNYVHFPLGTPSAASSVDQLFAPATYRLSYGAFPDGSLAAGDRVPLTSEYNGGTGRIRDVAANFGSEKELTIAANIQVDYLRRKQAGQVGTLFFQEGIPVAYQLLSFTPAFSADPAILSDRAGQLYITWLEKGELPGFVVYFASTAPDIRAALDVITWADVGRLAGESLFGLASGALFVPFVLVWMIAPMVVLGLTSRIRREDESLTGLGTLIGLGLAMGAYWAGKLVTIPAMRDYVPFSAWLPIVPPWLNLPLRLGVPLLIAALALLIAWRYTYGRQNRALLFFMLIYIAIDGVLTMAVYGVIIFGAY